MSKEHQIVEHLKRNYLKYARYVGLSLLIACGADIIVSGDTPFLSAERSQSVIDHEHPNNEMNLNQGLELAALQLGMFLTGISLKPGHYPIRQRQTALS